jgi:DNA ligase-1
VFNFTLANRFGIWRNGGMKLATTLIPDDPTGWWMSEKFDGVRAIWDGSRFITRNGHQINVPGCMVEEMPDCRLDGELWMGPGSFDKLVSVIQTPRADWGDILYMAFDQPSPKPFEERQADLAALDLPLWVNVARQTRCLGKQHLNAFERDVVARGGEGAVIVAPGSKYRPGRSDVMVKVKRLVADLDRSCCD